MNVDLFKIAFVKVLDLIFKALSVEVEKKVGKKRGRKKPSVDKNSSK